MKSYLLFIALISYALILPSSIIGQSNNSLQFDGTDDYIEVSNASINAIENGDFTFEAWVKGYPDDSVHPTIFSNRENMSTGAIFFFHNYWGDSEYKMLCVQLGGLNYLLINNGNFNAEILDGTCHHVAITRDGSILAFYVDGDYIGMRNIQENPTLTSPARIWIGSDPIANGTFSGTISQVRLWDIGRSEEEINETKDFSIPGDTPNLVSYWELNDGSGQDIYDKTENTVGVLGYTNYEDIYDPQWSEEEGCQVVTSLNEIKENILVSIYPNPAQDFITVALGKDYSHTEVRISNNLGQTIIAYNSSLNSQNPIDISNLSDGVYFVTITVDDKTTTQKIIVKK